MTRKQKKKRRPYVQKNYRSDKINRHLESIIGRFIEHIRIDSYLLTIYFSIYFKTFIFRISGS